MHASFSNNEIVMYINCLSKLCMQVSKISQNAKSYKPRETLISCTGTIIFSKILNEEDKMSCKFIYIIKTTSTARQYQAMCNVCFVSFKSLQESAFYMIQ